MKLSRKFVLVAIVTLAACVPASLAYAGSTAPTRGDREQQGEHQHGNRDNTNGLKILGNDCEQSRLKRHDGFQKAPRCVETAFGEVAKEGNDPTLLIVKAPTEVAAGQSFTIDVSTRNLLRDRFLAAGAGGYYLESSFLTKDGIQRGHFHTACRALAATDVAPDPAPAPAFFKATEDGKGSKVPDTVTITVPGLNVKGTTQCAVWAGDGSHRIPMMQRANQTPAFDAVRVTVK